MSEQTSSRAPHPGEPYYITTAIDYVNARPHLGHAYEKIATDVMARYQRLRGRDVFFLTGTDEHGTKVEKTALDQGLAPKAYVDGIADSFRSTWEYLGLTHDRFIRTTDTDHYALVSTIWQRLVDKKLIDKASYEGQYCTGCEAFLAKRDLTDDGLCHIHRKAPDTVTEENYFFKLSAFKDQLAAHIQANPQFILPAFRAQEVLKMLENVEDISVSRPVSSVSWGIPVPGDDSQVIYVWIDALSNYLTGIGCFTDDALFNRYWGTDSDPRAVHVIGKDILRFHAIYWPAILLGAGLPLYKTLFVHGFINLNDAKISKSLGNVISVQDLVARYELQNPDAVRYYLMSVATFGYDGNFTDDDFKTRINADLANNLGNLLNRTLNMTQKYFDGRIPDGAVTQTAEDITAAIAPIADSYEQFSFQTALAQILEKVDAANKTINEAEPWTLHKEGRLDELARVMRSVLGTLRQVAILISPVTPLLAQQIWEQLGYAGPLAGQTWEDIAANPIPVGQAICLKGPILPRLESELAGSAKHKK